MASSKHCTAARTSRLRSYSSPLVNRLRASALDSRQDLQGRGGWTGRSREGGV